MRSGQPLKRFGLGFFPPERTCVAAEAIQSLVGNSAIQPGGRAPRADQNPGSGEIVGVAVLSIVEQFVRC